MRTSPAKEILNDLDRLTRSADPTKARLEHSDFAEEFIEALGEAGAWKVTRELLHPDRRTVEKPLVVSQPLAPQALDDIIASLIGTSQGQALANLSRYRDHIHRVDDVAPETVQDRLVGLLRTGCLQKGERLTSVCVQGHIRRPGEGEPMRECPRCTNRLSSLHNTELHPDVRDALEANHHLELYAKSAFEDEGIKLLRTPTEEGRVATSVKYNVEGDKVEMDLVAVQNSTVILVECKTRRLTQTQLSKERAAMRELEEQIEQMTDGGVSFHRVFITSRKIDRNVNEKRPNETLIGGAQLGTLSDQIRKTKQYVA